MARLAISTDLKAGKSLFSAAGSQLRILVISGAATSAAIKLKKEVSESSGVGEGNWNAGQNSFYSISIMMIN